MFCQHKHHTHTLTPARHTHILLSTSIHWYNCSVTSLVCLFVCKVRGSPRDDTAAILWGARFIARARPGAAKILIIILKALPHTLVKIKYIYIIKSLCSKRPLKKNRKEIKPRPIVWDNTIINHTHKDESIYDVEWLALHFTPTYILSINEKAKCELI